MEDVYLEVIGTTLTFIIGVATVIIRERFKLEFSEKQRVALHTALIHGIQLAAEKKLSGNAMIDLAIQYARDHSPEATAAAERSVRQSVGDLSVIVEALKPKALKEVQ